MASKMFSETGTRLETDRKERDDVYRKMAWRIIPFLMLCYVFAYLDRSNIGLAKIVLSKQLGFNEAVYGFGAGLFYLGYCLFEVPSNLLLKKMGARSVFMRIAMAWGIVSAAFAFMSNREAFYILRFLLGVAEAGFFPGVLLYLTVWAPASRRARFTAIFMSSMAFAGLIGGPLSGWLMTATDGRAGIQGWQWMFLLEGVPACLLGVTAYFVLVDSPAQARWLDDREREIIRRDLLDDEEGLVERPHTTFGAALRDPRLYFLAGMSVALISGIGGISLWLPSILHRAGITNIGRLGLLSSLPYAAAIVSQQYIARRSDRHRERRWHAAVPAICGGLGWLMLPFVSSRPTVSLLCLTVAAAGTFGATGPFWSLPAAYLRGTAAAGGIAVITTFGGFAAFLSPLLVGWAAEKTGSLAAGQYYYGALLISGACLLIAGTRHITAATNREDSGVAAPL
ncbi:MAG: putative phthalate transporter [Gammaproteobacteria bacterium]|nr:putative phthalate transporter [Gammaproteobacteria bacterium]